MADTLLRGHLLDADTGAPLPNLRVEAWDQNDSTQPPDYLGGDVSALDGSFRISFDSTTVNGAAGGRAPDVYVDVFSGSELVASTAAAPFDDLAPGSHDLAVPVRLESLSTAPASKTVPVLETVRISGKVEVNASATALTASPAGLRVTVRPAGKTRTLAEAAVDGAGVYAFDFPHPGPIPDPNALLGTVDLWLGRPGETPELAAEAVDLYATSTPTLAIGPVERPALGGDALFDVARGQAQGVFAQPLIDAYGSMTLAQVREGGGVDAVLATETGADRLDALALLDAVSPDPVANGALVDAGMDSLDALVTASPDRIVSAIGGTVAEAEALRGAASRYRDTTDAVLVEAALALAAGREGGGVAAEVRDTTTEVRDVIATILPAPAADDDACSLATGPVAYVSALADAVRDGFAFDASATTLEAALHVPVEALEARRLTAREELVALRPVAESLLSLAGASVSGDVAYTDAAYEALLAELGTTPAELAAYGGLSTDAQRRLADRLGLPGPAALATLKLASPTGTDLEATYGLRQLDRGSPTEAMAASALYAFRQTLLQRRWRIQDWGRARDKGTYPSSGAEPFEPIPTTALTVPVADRPRLLIDPDLIPLEAVPEVLSDGVTPNPARAHYTSRAGAIANYAASVAAGLGGAEPEAFIAGQVYVGDPDPAGRWESLMARYAAGESVAEDLALVHLDATGMKRLAAAWESASGAGLDAAGIEEVTEILVEVWKRPRLSPWRRIERDGEANDPDPMTVTLSPTFFSYEGLEAAEFEPSYRARRDHRDAWARTLAARTSESAAVLETLLDVTRRAERAALPALVDRQLDTHGGEVAAEARLLTDLLPGAGRSTTRVDHTIGVLQRLIGDGLRGDVAPELPQPVDLGAVEQDWQWLRTYDTWRAAMSVYLYPENAATPTSRSHASEAFSTLSAAALARGASVDDAAADYSAYAEAVGDLVPVASCMATEVVPGPGGRRAVRRTFAFAQTGGVLYWTAVDDRVGDVAPGHPWAPVPGAPADAVVLGAAPAELDADRRYVVLLLADPAAGGGAPVEVFRFDLEEGSWRTEPDGAPSVPVELPLHPGGTVRGCVIHRATELVDTPGGRRTPSIRLAWRASPAIKNRTVQMADLDVETLMFDALPGAEIRLPEPILSIDAGWELAASGEIDPAAPRPPQFVVACRTEGADGLAAYLGVVDPHLAQSQGVENGLHVAMVPLADLAANRPVGLHGAPGSPFVTAFTWSATESTDGTRTEGTHAQTFRTTLELAPEGSGATETEVDEAGGTGGGGGTDTSDVYRVSVGPYTDDVAPTPLAVYGVTVDGRSLLDPEGSLTLPDPGVERYVAHAVTLPGGPGADRIRRSRLVQTVTAGAGPQDEPTVDSVVSTVGSLATRLFAVAPPKTPAERAVLQQRIGSLHGAATGVDRFYIDEAFFGVPMLMMDALRRRRRADEAADWARALYDDAAPDAQRVVYTPLADAVDAIPATLSLPDLDAFDALDPTAVFSARRPAQLRYALTGIGRVLLAEADTAFARDTPESVSAARRTYARVERLLGHPVLAQPEVADATGGTTVGALAAGAAKARTRARLAVHALPSAQLRLRDVGAAVAPAAAHQRAADLGLGAPAVAPPATRLLKLSEGFAVPPNPVVRGLRSRAENGLRKIRLGLNAAGLERPLVVRDTDLVVTSARGAAVRYQPTPYRATFLLDRARQLAGQAQQAEAAFLQALERYDAERFSQLQAEQQIEVAVAGVRLQDVRVNEASAGVQLAGVQLSRSTLQRDHFRDLFNVGELEDEKSSLGALERGLRFHNDVVKELGTDSDAAQGVGYLSAIFSGAASGGALVAAMPGLGQGIGAAMGLAGAIFGRDRTNRADRAQHASARAQHASANASYFQQQASYERRAAEWAFQRDLAGQDIQAARLGIRAARSRVLVVEQERLIAALHVQHAAETARFLATKFTNAALYAWMSGVLEEVYTFYVRLATSTAQLALAQLAFERQEPAPALLAGDYLLAEDGADRRGLTGSARLQADLARVEQHALETDRRALQLVKTVSLSQQDPAAFEAFRRTGRLPFALAPELFDRDHPGHYLRLVRSVSVSVVALVPPTQGIRASLLSGGLSPVVIEDGGVFRSVPVRRDPERVALSSPYAATGVFELGADGAQRYLPFEGGGVSGGWQLELPKAANPFDYGSIADVLVTVQYTAHHSDAYRAEVIDRLGRTLDAARPLSFRDDFADAWYDALNADRLPVGEPAPEAAVPGRPLPTRSWTIGAILSETERSAWNDVVVEVPVERTDFPPNLADLELLHAAVYAVRPDGIEVEFSVTAEFFPVDDLDGTGTHGPAATLAGPLRDGLLSSRAGAATATGWNDSPDPVGVWRFTFDGAAQAALNDDVDDLLLVLSYRAETPAWLA